MFIFSFALEKYFDKKITSAVNNSYEIAKNYLDEKINKIESEIVLIAFDLNKYSNLIKENPERFQAILNTQRVIRDIDKLHLIDDKGNLIQSAINSPYKKLLFIPLPFKYDLFFVIDTFASVTASCSFRYMYISSVFRFKRGSNFFS